MTGSSRDAIFFPRVAVFSFGRIREQIVDRRDAVEAVKQVLQYNHALIVVNFRFKLDCFVTTLD